MKMKNFMYYSIYAFMIVNLVNIFHGMNLDLNLLFYTFDNLHFWKLFN